LIKENERDDILSLHEAKAYYDQLRKIQWKLSIGKNF
jgi:hypothetical protein